MKLPDIHSSEIIYEGFFNLRVDRLVREDGKTLNFTSVEFARDAAVVLAEDRQGRLILNREYRHSTRQFVLCIPGGGMENGEDPVHAGQRELREETGYESAEFSLLGCCYPFPGVCGQKIFHIHAKNAVLGAGRKLDPFEFIETVLLTEEELKHEVRSGALIDGLLCTALWYRSQIAMN